MSEVCVFNCDVCKVQVKRSGPPPPPDYLCDTCRANAAEKMNWGKAVVILKALDEYVSFYPTTPAMSSRGEHITLDGSFTLRQLQAMVWWMENRPWNHMPCDYDARKNRITRGRSTDG